MTSHAIFWVFVRSGVIGCADFEFGIRLSFIYGEIGRDGGNSLRRIERLGETRPESGQFSNAAQIRSYRRSRILAIFGSLN